MYIVHILYLNMYKRTKRLIILSVEHKTEALVGWLCGSTFAVGVNDQAEAMLSHNYIRLK